MQLQLKSYRGFILKLALIFLIVSFLMIIGNFIYLSFFPEDWEDMFMVGLFIIFIVLALTSFIVIIIARFYNGANYIFKTDSIHVYKGKKFKEKIDLENVETIYYHPFRFRYVVTIFGGELMDGGAWKLHVKFKDGTKKSLCFFSLKNVEQIKEIYGDLINIKLC